MIFKRKKKEKKPKNLKINVDTGQEESTDCVPPVQDDDPRPDRVSLAKDMKKIRVNTYTKALVMIIIAIALIDLQLSYLLAFLGRDNIAQDLSMQVCTTIIAVAFAYFIRAYFDSKAEHANDPIEVDITDELEAGINDKLTSILSSAGLTTTVNAFKSNKDKKEDDEEDQLDAEVAEALDDNIIDDEPVG